jgi:hypothetical protein
MDRHWNCGRGSARNPAGDYIGSDLGILRNYERRQKVKLRNNNTREIKAVNHAKILVHFSDGTTDAFNSVKELTDKYSDYTEPLIKNEKIRKAVRAWLSIQKQPITAISILCSIDHDGFFCYHLYGYIDKARVVDGKAVVNKNLTAIGFEFRAKTYFEYDRDKDYTIAELCGEEEE